MRFGIMSAESAPALSFSRLLRFSFGRRITPNNKISHELLIINSTTELQADDFQMFKLQVQAPDLSGFSQ